MVQVTVLNFFILKKSEILRRHQKKSSFRFTKKKIETVTIYSNSCFRLFPDILKVKKKKIYRVFHRRGIFPKYLFFGFSNHAFLNVLNTHLCASLCCSFGFLNQKVVLGNCAPPRPLMVQICLSIFSSIFFYDEIFSSVYTTKKQFLSVFPRNYSIITFHNNVLQR